MRPLLKNTLTSLFFFLLGLVIAALGSFTAFSYFTVTHLSKAFHETPATPSDLNPNLKAVILMAAKVIKELDQVEAQHSLSLPQPPLDKVICRPEGRERLNQAELLFLTRLFPSSLRHLMLEVSQNPPWNTVLQMQWAVFQEMTRLLWRWESTKQEIDRLKELRQKMKKCRQQSPIASH